MRRPAHNRKDMTFDRFGSLTVVSYVTTRNGKAFWYCTCDCGGMVVASATNLRTGHTKSCGCIQQAKRASGNPTHGRSHTIEYKRWCRMWNRCSNPNADNYRYYGGRGIKVCERWESFEHFFQDMGPIPSADMSIERINNDGNYEPTNCKWATKSEQALNRRKKQCV